MTADYIAWLDGQSIARGHLAEVRAAALRIFETPTFQQFAKPETVLRITRGSRQLFVSSVILRKGQS